jgi:hypothetical protein
LEAAYADENLTILLKIEDFEVDGVATQYKHTENDIRWSYEDYLYVEVGLDLNDYYVSAWYDSGD